MQVDLRTVTLEGLLKEQLQTRVKIWTTEIFNGSYEINLTKTYAHY